MPGPLFTHANRPGTNSCFTGACKRCSFAGKSGIMKISLKVILAHVLLLIGTRAFSQKPVANILGTPATISFAGKMFSLSWSSHLTPDYYKEEFMVKGETAEKFRSMLLLDAVKSSGNLDEVVEGKLAGLSELKKTNPDIFYQEVAAPAGERMIDFTMTASSADGKTLIIAERNVYRYRVFTDKSGKKGIMLCGIAQREYGKAIPGFLAALKTSRELLVTQMRGFVIPVFTSLQ